MLCAPSERAAAPVAALLLHEGSTHHIGNGRAYVALARQHGFRLATLDQPLAKSIAGESGLIELVH